MKRKTLAMNDISIVTESELNDSIKEDEAPVLSRNLFYSQDGVWAY